MIKYSVLVPYYSHPLDELIKQADRRNDVEIIAAMTGESDVDLGRSKHKKIKCVRCGYGKAVNTAFRESGGEILVIMNDDVILEENFFEKLDSRKFEALIPRVIDAKTNETESVYAVVDIFGYGRLRKRVVSNETPFVPGSVFAIKRNLFEKTGMFDEDYFMYYEDIDFSANLIKEIFPVIASDIIAYHKHSFSDRGMKRYFLQRNRLLFILKNCSSALLVFFVLYAMTFENLVMVLQIIKQKSILPLKARIDFFKMFPLFYRKRK
ncbi:MAG: glycosyltransferase [bacterium]|nr:glycosyltransferase [bacterium]